MLNVFDIAYQSPSDFAKTVLSSGDYFPGFYRFTMGDRIVDPRQLNVSCLLDCFFNQKKFSQEEWTKFSKENLKMMNDRLEKHSDSSVTSLLSEKYFEWMTEADCYDVAFCELENTDKEFQKNRTYFLMGSLIRVEDSKLKIGYDLLRNESLLEVDIDEDEIVDFVRMSHRMSFKDLFLPCDLVASIKDDVVQMTDETVVRVMSESESVLIASNRGASSDLPIRFAKDICLTKVC